MAVFSTNQVRQMYVVTDAAAAANATPTNQAGAISVCNTQDKKSFYFKYKNAMNEPLRSDLIDVNKIINATYSTNDGEITLRQATVTMNGDPVAGETYIVRINIRQAFGKSDEETYLKEGVFRALPTSTASDVYAGLAVSLAKNFSREYTQFFDFYLVASGGDTAVTASTKLASLTGTYTGIKIVEHPQTSYYRRGLSSVEQVYFEVFTNEVMVNTVPMLWGEVAYADSATKINNTYALADLEWFLAGEKGDIYRGVNYPNNIDTVYMINPSATAANLSVLNIHFAYADGGMNNQLSERDIVLVGEAAKITALKTKIETMVKTTLGKSDFAFMS